MYPKIKEFNFEKNFTGQELRQAVTLSSNTCCADQGSCLDCYLKHIHSLEVESQTPVFSTLSLSTVHFLCKASYSFSEASQVLLVAL